MSTFFWADTHFNHTGILGHTTRPYKNVGEMNLALIDLWNARVPKEGDLVWVLGDFGFHAPSKEGTTDLGELWWRLRGKKSLVVGNHDAKNAQVLRLPWEDVTPLTEFKEKGQKATLCHYPLTTWPASWRGSMMLHGHCHGTLKQKLPKRFDVGVDTPLGASGPVPWELLVELAMAETFKPVDGHGEGGEEE